MCCGSMMYENNIRILLSIRSSLRLHGSRILVGCAEYIFTNFTNDVGGKDLFLMRKNHPLAYILRKKTAKDIDFIFDMIVMHAYLAGQFGNKIPVDDTREAWKHIKKLLSTS